MYNIEYFPIKSSIKKTVRPKKGHICFNVFFVECQFQEERVV